MVQRTQEFSIWVWELSGPFFLHFFSPFFSFFFFYFLPFLVCLFFSNPIADTHPAYLTHLGPRSYVTHLQLSLWLCHWGMTSNNVLKLISWNVKGTGSATKLGRVMTHLDRLKGDTYFLQEIHTLNRETVRLKKGWVGEVFSQRLTAKPGVLPYLFAGGCHSQ